MFAEVTVKKPSEVTVYFVFYQAKSTSNTSRVYTTALSIASGMMTSDSNQQFPLLTPVNVITRSSTPPIM